MENRSMVDVAFDLMQSKKKAINFQKLFKEVSEIKGLGDDMGDKISQFYTNITLDGRFITVGENQWDLRSRHGYAAVHIDMNDIYADDEDDQLESELDDELDLSPTDSEIE